MANKSVTIKAKIDQTERGYHQMGYELRGMNYTELYELLEELYSNGVRVVRLTVEWAELEE